MSGLARAGAPADRGGVLAWARRLGLLPFPALVHRKGGDGKWSSTFTPEFQILNPNSEP